MRILISGWKAYTGSPPEFDQGRDYTKATFYLKKVSEDKLGNKLGNTEQRILEIIAGNPDITIAQIAAQLNIAATTVEYNMDKLRKKDLLERVGSRKKAIGR